MFRPTASTRERRIESVNRSSVVRKTVETSRHWAHEWPQTKSTDCAIGLALVGYLVSAMVSRLGRLHLHVVGAGWRSSYGTGRLWCCTTLALSMTHRQWPMSCQSPTSLVVSILLLLTWKHALFTTHMYITWSIYFYVRSTGTYPISSYFLSVQLLKHYSFQSSKLITDWQNIYKRQKVMFCKHLA